MIYLFFWQAEVPSRPTSQIPLLAENELQILQDLMSEAMEETDGQQVPCPQQNGSDFSLLKKIHWECSGLLLKYHCIEISD